MKKQPINEEIESFVFAILPHVFTFLLSTFLVTWLLTGVKPLLWEIVFMWVATVYLILDINERRKVRLK